MHRLCYSLLGPRLQRVVTELTGRLGPQLNLWMAGVCHNDIPPQLQVEALTTPLRSAPAVVREVEVGISLFKGIHNYSDSGLPAPGDGLSVVRLRHQGNAHTGRWPVDCPRCGQAVAAELRRLGVGPVGEWIDDDDDGVHGNHHYM